MHTPHEMAPFARDLGYGGPPFIWDEEERRHLRARLDALYFHLYGLDRADAGYVLDTFPIVRREDEAQFDGRYRTKELILAYMNALAPGIPRPSSVRSHLQIEDHVTHAFLRATPKTANSHRAFLGRSFPMANQQV